MVKRELLQEQLLLSRCLRQWKFYISVSAYTQYLKYWSVFILDPSYVIRNKRKISVYLFLSLQLEIN